MNINIIMNGTMMVMIVNTVVCLGQEYKTRRIGNTVVVHTNPLISEKRKKEIIEELSK